MRFGSIKTSFSSSGFFLLINEIMKLFKPTDLPEPVVPATSKCGILDKSFITVSPRILTPRQIGSA